MGKLYPDEREIDLQVHFFQESAHLLGKSITIELTLSVDRDNYNDPDIERKPPIQLDVIRQERPPRKTLEDLGWWNDNQESLPVLMYFTKKDLYDEDIEFLQWSLVSYPYNMGYGKQEAKKYIITDVNYKSFGSFYCIAKLVPYRPETHNELPVNQDPNYQILKSPKE